MGSNVKVPQPISIQLLFDLKFIGLATVSSLDPTYAQIEQQIEKMIDPFDLAVLASHIQANSSKAIQKTSVLHGALIASSGFQGSKHLATSTSNEKHNILRLSEVTARFSLLPTPTIN